MSSAAAPTRTTGRRSWTITGRNCDIVAIRRGVSAKCCVRLKAARDASVLPPASLLYYSRGSVRLTGAENFERMTSHIAWYAPSLPRVQMPIPARFWAMA
jgi:hypothetical protein